MARQYFIPGDGALNETGRRQYFIPGFGAAGESGVAGLSASFAETLTASDGHGSAMTASTAFSEPSTASDQYLPVPRYFQSLIPGGYALNEGVARQFFIPGHGAVNQTGRAKIIPPVTVAASYPIGESSSTSDGLTSSGAFSAPLSDFAFASDVPAAVPTYPARYGKAGYGRATYGSPGKKQAAAASTGGVSAKYGRATYGRARYASAGGATPSPTFTAPYVTVRFGDSVGETISVSDLIGALASFSDSMAESITGSEDLAAIASFVDSLAAGLTAAESLFPHAIVPPPAYRIIKADGHIRLEKAC